MGGLRERLRQRRERKRDELNLALQRVWGTVSFEGELMAWLRHRFDEVRYSGLFIEIVSSEAG